MRELKDITLNQMFTKGEGNEKQIENFQKKNGIWNKDISVNCPGVGKGKLISQKKIKKLLKGN